jgi:hypothetical protein
VRRKARVDFVKHTEWSRKSERERAEERLLLTFLLHNNSRNQHQWWRGTMDQERRGEERQGSFMSDRGREFLESGFGFICSASLSAGERATYSQREREEKAGEGKGEGREGLTDGLAAEAEVEAEEGEGLILRIGSPAVGLGDTGDSTERSPHSAE